MTLTQDHPILSILITSYNRPASVKICLQHIMALELRIPYEIVVSDDGSSEENLAQLKALPHIDKLVTAPHNQGLGANINKGLRACSGIYLLYCQEDFLLRKDLSPVIPHSIECIEKGKLDMVRYQANYQFPKLIPVEGNIFRIPKISFRNFLVNTFQYSDNPFLTRLSFFNEYGYFIEGTRGDYGEAEFAIRIARSKAKIGITKPYYVQQHEESSSTMVQGRKKRTLSMPKKLHKFARAIRQHFELICYSKTKRRLLTYNSGS